jgi:hypothetical protein
MEGNTVKLTWSQSNDHISGFALFRSAEGEALRNLTQTQKSTTQYIDANFTPGKKYIYYILAVAGTNKSDTIKAEITPVITITISTGLVTDLEAASAKVSGNITNAGGDSVIRRGICWSSNPNPTINNSKIIEGSGTGQYASVLSGLIAGSTYFVRAFGENSRGIAYGNQVTFTTFGPPKLTTIPVTSVTAVSAISGGIILTDGVSPIIAKGVVWSTSPNPTTVLITKTNDGTGIGSFSSSIFNLTENTKYYIRSYAVNALGTSYGDELSFITVPPSTSVLESLKQGMIGYYPFNGNANDESGNGNHGVVNGATLTLDRFGISNRAYDLNSLGANITTSLLAPTGKNPRSISFWFFTNEINNTNHQWIMVGYGGDVEFTNLYASLWDNSSVGIDIGASYVVYNTNIIGKWHNLTLVYESSFGNTVASIKTYLDGTLLRDIKTQTANFEINTGNSSKRPFSFGPPVSPIQSLQTFKGKLDDIRIYNRVLTQQEITELTKN